MTTTLRTADDDDLVRISAGHPLIRHLVPHRVATEAAWSYGSAVALVNGYWDAADEPGDLMLVGPPEDAAALARLLVPQRRPMAMPAAAYELLPAGLLEKPSPWGFRWSDSPTRTAPDAAAWLDSRPEVEQLLDEAFPDASFRPSSPRVRGWAGIRDAEGRLVACAADTTEAPGVGFVAAITTSPELRGNSLGRQVTGWLVDRLVERACCAPCAPPSRFRSR